MVKNRRNRKLSKNAILSEAKDLFSKASYRGTTIGNLTDRFGVTKPSIYYYFKNKREILSELHTRAFNELIKNFDKIAASDMNIKEKFNRILENHALVVANNADLVKIFFQDDIEIPKTIRNRIRKKRKAYTEKIIDLYKQGLDAGTFKKGNPKIVVYLLLGSCNWLCRWYSKDKEVAPDSVVKALMEILCEGYERP